MGLKGDPRQGAVPFGRWRRTPRLHPVDERGQYVSPRPDSKRNQRRDAEEAVWLQQGARRKAAKEARS